MPAKAQDSAAWEAHLAPVLPQSANPVLGADGKGPARAGVEAEENACPS